MLWLEREVVAALSAGVEPDRRGKIEAYVEGVLRDMPEHLRIGVAGESVVLGALVRLTDRVGTGRDVHDWMERWARSPVGPIRQYVRLLESLVVFATEELAPAAGEQEPVTAAGGT